MPGHGSTPDPDRAHDPARQVGRDTGMHKSLERVGQQTREVMEYRPEVGSGAALSDRGTRYKYSVMHSNTGGGVWGARQGDVRTLRRAQAATRSAGRRLESKYQGG